MAATVSPALANGATTWQFVFDGLSAHASFDSIDGCIETFAAVGGGDGVFKDARGRPVHLVAETLIIRHDICTGADVLVAVGHGPGSFTMDRDLEAAILTASIPVVDLVSGTSFPVDVDMSWTGVGPVSKGGFHEIVSLPANGGTLWLDRGVNTRSRDATALGAISIGTQNYARSFSAAEMEDTHFLAVTVSVP